MVACLYHSAMKMEQRYLTAERSKTVCDALKNRQPRLATPHRGSATMSGSQGGSAAMSTPHRGVMPPASCSVLDPPPVFQMLGTDTPHSVSHRLKKSTYTYPHSLPNSAIHKPGTSGGFLPPARAATTPLRTGPPKRRGGQGKHVRPDGSNSFFTKESHPHRRVRDCVRGTTPIAGTTGVILEEEDTQRTAQWTRGAEVAARVDSGAFRTDPAKPVRCRRTGAVQSFEEVWSETQQMFAQAKGRSKPLRRMLMGLSGIEMDNPEEGKLIDLSGISDETGFEQTWLDGLAKDFVIVVRCRPDQLLRDEAHAKMDWPQFKVSIVFNTHEPCYMPNSSYDGILILA